MISTLPLRSPLTQRVLRHGLLPRLSPTLRTRIPAPRPGYFVYPMASITTPPAGKFEWLVVIPDKPGTQAKRVEVRAKHLEGVKSLAESGLLKTGGALFNDLPESDDPSKFNFYGSTVVCIAASKEEVLEKLKGDIYATSGVWDLDNIQIWPAKFAFRIP